MCANIIENELLLRKVKPYKVDNQAKTCKIFINVLATYMDF